VLTAQQLKALLSLKPLAREGGYFAETYRSSEAISATALPSRYQGAKPFGTAIYFLLTPDTFSVLHRLPTDEVYHFYLGDPVEMLQLRPNGSGTIVVLGHDLVAGMHLQLTVPRGTWQGARLRPGGSFALMGTTMAPGFDSGDFEAGSRAALLAEYSGFRELILALTREHGQR
jgi:predicted cupin superfamily sugar epimerase